MARERERERERETDEIDAAKPGGLWNSAILWHCKHTKQQQRLSSVTTWNPRRWETFSIYCFEKLTQWLRTFFCCYTFYHLLHASSSRFYRFLPFVLSSIFFCFFFILFSSSPSSFFNFYFLFLDQLISLYEKLLHWLLRGCFCCCCLFFLTSVISQR